MIYKGRLLFFKIDNYRPLFPFFFLFTQLYRIGPGRLQQASNLDHWCWRWARWPLDDQKGCFSIHYSVLVQPISHLLVVYCTLAISYQLFWHLWTKENCQKRLQSATITQQGVHWKHKNIARGNKYFCPGLESHFWWISITMEIGIN